MISLIGLPGSGKTFLANSIAKKNDLIYMQIQPGFARYRLFSKYCLKHPLNLVRLVYWTFKLHEGSLKLIKHKLVFLLINALAKEEASSEHSLVDDGLLQYICAISDIEINQQIADNIVNKLVLKDRKVMLVESENVIRLERIKLRDRLPRSMFGEEYTKKFYTNMQKNIVFFSNVFRQRFVLETIKN